MSPIDDDIRHRCIFAIIHDGIADLCDLNINHNCTDQKETPPKIGALYVELITFYLKENKDLLKIHSIEFHDNSHFRCPDDRSMSLHLELSRQLEGLDPYYMQFGYRPKQPSSQKVLDQNKQIMSQYKTSDFPFKELYQVSNCPPNLSEYVNQHQTQPLSRTLRYISHHYCQFYTSIYRMIFDRCGLRPLNHPIYHMEL